MGPKRAYHRENLRGTLLTAAVELVGEVGMRAFNLREVARRAAVSHNAPYRHFKSKDDLLLAVAAEGFDRLAETMLASMAAAQDAAEGLELCGAGYVEFALRWPNYLTVMFDLPPEVRAKCAPQGQIGGRAFAILLEAVSGAQQAGAMPPGDVLSLALMCWSLTHGIAKLAAGGNLPMTPEQIISFTRWTARMRMAQDSPLTGPGQQTRSH